MIVRIATEGQYEVKGEALGRLDEADDKILDAITVGDEDAFRQALSSVVALVQTMGKKLPDARLAESDLILPAPDMTLVEARELFSDYPRDLQG